MLSYFQNHWKHDILLGSERLDEIESLKDEAKEVQPECGEYTVWS